MSVRTRLRTAVIVLVVFHLGVACAGFLAPYDPAAQDRQHPYAPPMRLHFVDAAGAATLVDVVDSRLRAHPFRHLFPGPGERRHQ